jgi:hypothetical protein
MGRIGLRPRDQRGVALPSTVVLLSVVAVVLAVVAFVITGGKDHDGEREIAPAADAPSATAPVHPHAKHAKQHRAKPKPKPEIQRGKIYVEVFNNTNIHGLAGTVAGKAATIGWDVVGADNWMGTVPATTVYYPPKLAAAGKQLALDLGVKRLHVAESGSMKADRLTLVLTGPLS